MTDIEVETAIIGGGQTGVPLARALAGAGRSVALIERAHLGGSCVNFGCTPSKAMIASARLAARARAASDLGLRIPRVEVDFRAVMDRARGLVAQSRGQLDASFAETDNPRLVLGHGRLDGRDGTRIRIRIDQTCILAGRVVLDTGSRTARPAIDGVDRVPTIDAENWIVLTELPGRLIFLGGGYIALEMSQAFRRLGAETVVLEKGGQIAEREDPDVAQALQAALERDGVAVHLNVDVMRLEAVDRGVRVHLRDGAIEGTHLFLAAGRQTNTDDLGLHTIGVRTDDHGMVAVDDRLRTSADGVWAAGDIRGGPAFTHTAYDDFRVLKSQFLGDGHDTRCRIVPYAMFTDPELGRVGMSETEARGAGREIAVGRHAMVDSGKARELGRTDGFIKVVADRRSGEILGASALCEQGSEVVQLFVELMNAGATTRTMLDAIHIHPTLAEAAKNAVVSITGD